MLYWFLLYSKVNQLYVHIYPLFFGFPSHLGHHRSLSGASLVAQMTKNPPAMQEIWVQPLGQKDSPEKGMATHSSILSWRIPWTEEPSGLHPCGHKESDTTEGLTHKYT